MTWRVAWVWGALVMLACSEGPGAADGGLDGPLGDGAPPIDAAPDVPVDAGPDATPDAAPDAALDAAPDALAPDAGVDFGPDAAGPITDCAAGCARLAGCGHLDPAEETACRARCARLPDPPTAWFDCLAAEADCALTRLCRLPEPPPLSCAAVCEAAVGCGIDLPFDCPAVCARAAGPDPTQPRFARCGEALAPACDGEAFIACLGAQVHPECGARCAGAAACGEPAPDCVPTCIAGLHAADPVVRRRAEDRTRCAALAGDDCLRHARCLAPDAPVDEAMFCAAWERCGDGLGLDCATGWQRGEGYPDYPTCVVEELLRGCPGEAFQIFVRCLDAEPDAAADCNPLCEAQSLCGLLPADETPLGCARACSTALNLGGLEDRTLAERRMPCAASPDCAALDACLTAVDPAVPCAEHCALRDACGPTDPACVADCARRSLRARQVAWQGCVAAAGDCADTAACDPGPAVGCDAACAREAACERVDPDCDLLCDDGHFADPDAALRRLACITAAPLCSYRAGVLGCVDAPSARGDACLGWCRAQLGCAAPDAALVGCLERCGEGLIGDAGSDFERARACLVSAGGLAPCPALAACLVDGPDCPAWCDALAGCGVAPPDCEALCGADPLTGWHAVAERQCLADAADCAEVMRCRASPADVFPGGARAALCARHDGCGFDAQFDCAAYFEVLSGDPPLLRCIFDGLEPCPADLDGLLTRCLSGGVESRTVTVCEASCRSHSRCEGLDGSIRDCTAACVEAIIAEPEGPEATRIECAGSVSCAALAACEAL